MSDKPIPRKGEPEPLPIGQKLNLRREMPGGTRAARDQGWEVIGYSYKNGKWRGYELRNAQGWLTKASMYEAIDKVEG